MRNANQLALSAAPFALLGSALLSGCGVGGNISCDMSTAHRVTVTYEHPDLGYYTRDIDIHGKVDQIDLNSAVEKANHLSSSFLQDKQKLQIPEHCSVS